MWIYYAFFRKTIQSVLCHQICSSRKVVQTTEPMTEPEKKDKAKKKKIIKRDSAGNIYEKLTDLSEDAQKESTTLTAADYELVEVDKDSNTALEKGNLQKSSKKKTGNAPEEFYIAHPRSIKRATEHFKDIHSRKLAELLEAFHLFDFDRDGIINHEDLKKTYASLNRTDVKDEEINQMLQEGLTPLNFDSFVILLGYKTLDLDPEEVLLDALSNWDNGHEGLVSYERLLHDLMAWGDKFSEEEAIAALTDAPMVLTRTKEKMIDYVQFSEDMCGLRKMMQRRPTNKTDNK